MGLFDKAKKSWENKVEPELKSLEKQVKEVWNDNIKPALVHAENVIGFVTKDPSKDLCADNIIDCSKIHRDAIVKPLEAAAITLSKIISDDEINCIKSKVSITLGEPSLENQFHNYKLALNHMISIGQNECSFATKTILKAIDAKGLVDSIVRSIENYNEKWFAGVQSIFETLKFKNIGIEAFFEQRNELNLKSIGEYSEAPKHIELPEFNSEFFMRELKAHIDQISPKFEAKELITEYTGAKLLELMKLDSEEYKSINLNPSFYVQNGDNQEVKSTTQPMSFDTAAIVDLAEEYRDSNVLTPAGDIYQDEGQIV